MSSGVLVFPPLKELEELLRATFLKETHEWATNSLHLCAGNLRDLAVAEDEGAGDLLELEVTRHIGMDEDASELARSDDEFGDEIDSVVAVAAEVLRRRGAIPELAVEL